MADENKTGGSMLVYSSSYVNPKERANVIKLDGSGGAIESSSIEYEDEFKGTYGAGGAVSDWRGAPGTFSIQPPVMPKTLEALVQQNNTLGQCIDAMVTNVHETGYEIELVKPPANEGAAVAEDARVKLVKGFLDEVWPGMSFKQLRKRTALDMEKTGNAYWEILRDRGRKMVMIRPLETKITRMVTMSDPTEQEVKIVRGGETITLRVMMRYRRFVQSLGSRYVFYKEHGCPLLINKHTGELLEDNPQNRVLLLRGRSMGTEVLHFRTVEDVDTPYGVPKWYPQMPSVLGSRKAEEHNLEYFEAGGVPPLMIFVQGGTMGKGMKEALEEFLSSKPGAKQGAPVFEVQSTGGTLDSPGSGARVTVERFGTERQKDSMFEQYDDKCEERVRRSWRLPPIFVGKADDYNLATAQASYAVAEAQVFKPDRDEFDELMNKTIIRELDPSGSVRMRSYGLPVKDVNQQLLAANAAFTAGGLDIDHYVETLNQIVSLNMKVRSTAMQEQTDTIKAKTELGQALVEVAKRPPPTQAGAAPGQSKPPSAKGKGSASGVSDSSKKPKVITKGDDLADAMMEAMSVDGAPDLPEVLDALRNLDADQVMVFKTCLQDGAVRDWLDRWMWENRYRQEERAVMIQHGVREAEPQALPRM